MILGFGESCNDSEQGARDILQVHPLVGLWVTVFDFQLMDPSSVLSGFTHALSVADGGGATQEILQFWPGSFTAERSSFSCHVYWDAIEIDCLSI
jgi:hypothetical protein